MGINEVVYKGRYLNKYLDRVAELKDQINYFQYRMDFEHDESCRLAYVELNKMLTKYILWFRYLRSLT